MAKKVKVELGRPTKYDPKFVAAVKKYLDQRIDEEEHVVKQENEEKGYVTYDNRLRVRLPTIEGFARYIGVNKTTLYEWEKDHPDFSNALDHIRTEQQERLIDNGLSGDYNSTIAKLILSSNHGMSDKGEVDITSKGERVLGIGVILDKAYGGTDTGEEEIT